jgi:putative DNA primase/helicase
VLRLVNSWYGKEDTKLTDRLLSERPGILHWSIDGWRRLQARGHFVQPDSGRAMIDSMEELSSPIGAFIREKCIVGAEHEVFVSELFHCWERWCEEKGKKDSGNEQTFGRDLRAAVPALEIRQPRLDGGRARKYVGIAIRV